MRKPRAPCPREENSIRPDVEGARQPCQPLFSIVGCLFKFYGPYLSQLSIAFPGLWARRYSISSEELDVSWNKDIFPGPKRWSDNGGVSLWHRIGVVVDTFTIRLTHRPTKRERVDGRTVFTRILTKENLQRFANRKRTNKFRGQV